MPKLKRHLKGYLYAARRQRLILQGFKYPIDNPLVNVGKSHDKGWAIVVLETEEIKKLKELRERFTEGEWRGAINVDFNPVDNHWLYDKFAKTKRIAVITPNERLFKMWVHNQLLHHCSHIKCTYVSEIRHIRGAEFHEIRYGYQYQQVDENVITAAKTRLIHY